jgi:transposase
MLLAVWGCRIPRQGRSFFYKLSHLEVDSFGEYLLQLSQAFPDELHILQIDNALAHIAGHFLEVTDNIILFYQPSCCPEVNPTERVWLYLKNSLA